MKTRKSFKTIAILVILLLGVAVLGVRREERRPNQHMNQYWAVRSLSIWTFFGAEVYAKNELAVYDMSGKTTKNLPAPIGQVEVQVRRFGKTIEGGSQYNLGEENYDRDGCSDYIYWSLGSSSAASHRLEATAVFDRALKSYPLTSKLKNSLVLDPSGAVKSRMQTILAHSH